MWKIKLVLILILLLSGCVATSLAHAAPSRRIDSVSDLWLDISLGPPLVDWFNRVARPDDVARVDHVKQIGLLDEITVGHKLVVFKSVAEAERFVPTIADRIDIIGYNLEQGPLNPSAEQADPVGSVKRMHDLAQQYGLKLAFGPDRRFALSDGVAVAPYVDIFVLQVQRVQTEPATVLDFALPLIRKLRQANPDLSVSVQVRTEGDVVAIVDLIDSMRDNLDGVSILTSPETVDIAEALVAELRTRKPAVPDLAATPSAPAARLETAVAPTPIQDTGPSCLLIMVGALAAGAVGGGVMSALICSPRSRAAGK